MRKEPIGVRFWRKVRRGPWNECWVWTGAKHGKKGYGSFRLGADFGRKTDKAHRVAFVLCGGVLPPGMQVLHSCDSPPCCNPNHLFLGDNDANVADRVAKGRTARWHLATIVKANPGLRPRGAAHGRSKLTETQVREILLSTAVGDAEWASRLGVSQTAIRLIRQRKNWRHIELVSSDGVG